MGTHYSSVSQELGTIIFVSSLGHIEATFDEWLICWEHIFLQKTILRSQASPGLMCMVKLHQTRLSSNLQKTVQFCYKSNSLFMCTIRIGCKGFCTGFVYNWNWQIRQIDLATVGHCNFFTTMLNRHCKILHCGYSLSVHLFLQSTFIMYLCQIPYIQQWQWQFWFSCHERDQTVFSFQPQFGDAGSNRKSKTAAPRYADTTAPWTNWTKKKKNLSANRRIYSGDCTKKQSQAYSSNLTILWLE